MSLLNLKLSDVDTSRPCLQSGKYPVIIKEALLKEQKNNPGSYQVMFAFATTEPAITNKGDTMKPGYTLTKFFSCDAMENEKAEEIRQQQLANLVDILTSGEVPRPDLTDELLPQFKGLALILSLSYEEDAVNKNTGEHYGPQNNIKGFYPIK